MKINDGGGGHLGLSEMLIISAWMKQFDPCFNCIHPAQTAIDPYDQKSKLSKIQDGGSFLSVLTVFIVDAIQKQQILMQKNSTVYKGC